MKVQLPLSLISSVRTLADGSIRITLDSQELSPEAMARLFLVKKSGELVEIETDMEAGEKTPSSRLRAVLYVLWEQTYPEEKPMNFDAFYRVKMGQICDTIKNKLI